MNEDIKKEFINILDAQLIGCILYILSLIIAIFIIIDAKIKLENKKGLFTTEESQNILFFNKTLIIVLLIFFLLLNYKEKDINESLKQPIEDNNLQILASYLSLIAGIIGLYIVIKDYEDTPIQIGEIENNYL